MGPIILLFRAILNIYQTLIILYVLMSWIPEVRSTQLGRTIGGLVEPYLSLFRRIIPPIGMLDISPLFAIIVLNLAMQGLYRLI